MKFTQLLYGKEASGTLIEQGDDDIARAMIQAALEGKAFKSAGDAIRQVFSTGQERTHRTTTEPTGSPIATSPAITVEKDVVIITLKAAQLS